MAMSGGQDLGRLTLRLGRDQLAEIEALAQAGRTSMATIARQLIQEALAARVARARAEHTPEELAAMEIEGPSDGGAI